MRILRTKNVYKPHQSFKREPSKEIKVPWNGKSEAEDYPLAIAEAKEFLGIKNLALILHQSSFPVSNKDLYIGSHINDTALELNKFLKYHGFDSVQIGPPGLTKLSPYASSINAKNYLYTDMELFATDEYANLLVINDKHDDIKKELRKIELKVEKDENTDLSNFNAAFYVIDKLYDKAYTNLLKKVERKDPKAIKLYNEFNEYKEKNDDWLDKNAVYTELKTILGMDDDFFEWPHMFRNLFEYKNNEFSPFYEEANEFYEDLYFDYGKQLDIFKFKQFIINKQEKDFKEKNGKLPYTTDAIIGFHMMDYYANKEAFLPGYRVGTPYGGEGHAVNGSPWGNNQTWDIPVLNPKKLFVKNEKGEIIGLGVAGKLLRKKFENLLDTYENLRIDHAIGLIDPWIYDKNRVEVKVGRFSNEEYGIPEHVIYKNAHGANISMFHKENVFGPDKGWGKEITDKINEDIKNLPDIDPDGDYAKILDEILLPLFKEKGVNFLDIPWETLGCDTPKFREVFDKKRDGKYIPEITSAYEWQIQKRLNSPKHKENTVILGCHDHPPFANICDDNFYSSKNCHNGVYEQEYIVGALYPELSAEQKSKKMEQLRWDRRLRVKLKFTEMLRFSQKLQLTFMDFFGLDKTYNYSGTQNPLNWKLRLKKTYKEDYYKALAWKPGQEGVYRVALNMPELLKRAVISKILCDKVGTPTENEKLLNKLDYYQKVLETEA